MSYRRLLLAVIGFIATSGLLFAGDWRTDYAKALETAKAENKRVLLEFTGSDWCPPCIALGKQVFSQPEFRAYAEKNLVLVEVDYPQRKKQSSEIEKQNEKLGKEYGIEGKGLPTIMLLDSAGKVMRESTGYGGESVSEFIAWIEGKSN
jgi:thioredoxin-related protein